MSSAQRVEASLSYMMQHLDQPMNVTALCAMTGLSESRYFEVFKRVTGRTPVNYLIHARMSRAAELLVGSLLQIKEVAVQVGYDDQFYFSRLFKSVHGSCPSEFRARNELLGSAQQNA